ncbi:MAG TPA: glycoside hydrolase family 3 N-terminal domain-containing protein [Solirubrobacteraceae bacterium]
MRWSLTPWAAIVVVLVVLALVVGGRGSRGVPSPRRALDATAAPAPDPADHLSVRMLAGERIITGYTGTTVPEWLLTLVRRGEVGGVIVYAENVASTSALAVQMSRLQAAARPLGLGPLPTMIDQEGGEVKRLQGPPNGSAAEMATRGTRWVRRQGVATAALLRSAGINVDLAPVADLARPGGFERATERSFGATPGTAGSLSAAFAKGLQAGGVAATLKHFPGLGSVTEDQDLYPQTVTLSLAVLRRSDERAFVPGVSAGTHLVLISTARYRALASVPAVIAPAVITGELRDRLGFTGVVMTDDLDVPSLSSFGTPAELGVRATLAGADLLVFAHQPADIEAEISALTSAVRTGRVPQTMLVASARRILALRADLAG